MSLTSENRQKERKVKWSGFSHPKNEGEKTQWMKNRHLILNNLTKRLFIPGRVQDRI